MLLRRRCGSLVRGRHSGEALSIQGRTSAHGRELNDPTRLVGEVAAILSIGAGVIHYSAAGDHTNLPVMLAGFIVVATLQVALGALLLWRRPPSRRLVLAGLALMVGAIGVWVLSRTQGLPLLEDGHAEPIGFKDGVTVVFELASIPALLLLLSRDLARVSLPSPKLEAQTLTALGASCFALMVPALMLGGGEHHSHEEAVEMGIHTDDHGPGEELAHAGSDSHGDDPDDGHHATKPDGKGHGHARAGDASGGHHSGFELASAPVTGHEHDGGGDGPQHHADDGGEGNHHDGHHRRDRRDRDHGHGDHEEDEPGGGGSGDEPPLSLSYDPEPSVCIATVCVP